MPTSTTSLYPGGGEAGQLAGDIRHRLGADGAAGLGDDAVGAVPLAPVLNLHIGPCPGAEGGNLHRLKRLPPDVLRDFDNPLAGPEGPV